MIQDYVYSHSDNTIYYTTNINKAEADSVAKKDSLYQQYLIYLLRFVLGFMYQTMTIPYASC